jgi:hypothetical protein
MRRNIAVLLLLCSFAVANPGRHTSSYSHPPKTASSKSHSSKIKAPKAVHVRGYTRKDGTYVAPYDRGATGSASARVSTTPLGAPGHPYRKSHLALGYSFHPSVQHDAHGKIKRSSSAKAAFERQLPCPSTGRTSGRCPGYIVDHVRPLECGGADAPSNMQWQTSAEAKAKDKTERNCRL